MRRHDSRGFGLILLITLIAIAAIFISGTTIFVTNAARETQLRVDRVKGASLAQAGVLRALHNWRVSNPTEANRRYAELNTTIFGAQGYRTGTQADFAYFMFDSPSNSTWTSNRRRYRAWTIKNIHTSSGASPLRNIVVTKAKVSWTPDGGVLLNGIRLNGASVMSGTASNGQEISLSGSVAQRRLTPGSRWSGNNTRLDWSGALPSTVKVTVQWTFSDNSATRYSRSHEVLYWDGAQETNDTVVTAARPSRHTFSVVSTGRIAESSGLPMVVDTVKATISGNAAGGMMEIMDWDRIDQNLAL